MVSPGGCLGLTSLVNPHARGRVNLLGSYHSRKIIILIFFLVSRDEHVHHQH